jgi:hypothetical protein
MIARRSNLALGAAGAIVVSLVALVVPILRGEFPAGHDSPAHLTYTYLFDRAIAEGHFPVRWIEWSREGHGQPLFNFYQPGLYYLVQIVHVVVPSLVLSLKLTILFVWWLGALFLYLLLKPLGRLVAGAGAVCFAFSPYILVDVFVRAAYPELAGIAFGTGVLWALDGWLRSQRPIWLPALASLAAMLVLSHPPTAAIFSPLFVVYVISLLAARQTTPRAVVALAFPAALASGLAAFYLVPALAELHLIRSRELVAGGSDYHQHFVLPRQWVSFNWGFGGSVPGAGDQMPFQIGIVQWLGLAGALILPAVRPRRAGHPVFPPQGWFIIAGLAMFMMTASSAPVWERIPPLAFAQFPWRFLMLVAVACAVLLAYALSLIGGSGLRTAAIIGAVALQIHVAHQHLTPKGYITRETIDIDWQDWLRSDKARKDAFIEPAYSPVSLTNGPRPDIGRWTIERGCGEVREVSVKGHELVLQASVLEPMLLRINSPAFPGWKVWINDRLAPSSSSEGYLAVELAPGENFVRAAFTNTTVRSVANAVTLTSAAVLLAVTVGTLHDPRVYFRRSGSRRSLGPS